MLRGTTNALMWPAWSLSRESQVDQGPDLLEKLVDGISVGLVLEAAQEDQIAAALESLNVMDLLVDVGQDGDPCRGLLGGDDFGVDLGGGKGEISPPRQGVGSTTSVGPSSPPAGGSRPCCCRSSTSWPSVSLV
jgi:hypothetical protein